MYRLKEILSIRQPIIMAPMFLVSNTFMVIEAMKSGVAGCIPALNYRTLEGLRVALKELKEAKVKGGAFGFNIIVNTSNTKAKDQLKVICEEGCDFIITSLGNPKEVIESAQPLGIKVFCDVTNLKYAQKVEGLGCDGVIAVNNQAGGHRGESDAKELIHVLKRVLRIPVISAGGVGTSETLKQALEYGADGVSVGSVFIAAKEAGVSEMYKEACVQYGEQDIILTKKLSGTPCTVINTPYVKRIGTEETLLEKIVNRNRTLKKWVKVLRYLKGVNDLTEAAQQATYKTLWVAGPSIEHTKKIRTVQEIIKSLAI